MPELRTIDTKLMNWLTLNGRYPNWSKAPKSFALKIAFFNAAIAVIAVWIAFGSMVFDSVVLTLWASFTALSSFYHFRIWYRYKNQ